MAIKHIIVSGLLDVFQLVTQGYTPAGVPAGEAVCVRASDATIQVRAASKGREWATDATPIHRARSVCI